jgi:hypothetical protein
VTWTPPTLNVDGSALTDISGYRILYGVSPTALTQSVFVAGSNVTSQVISGLAPGTFYFAVATVNLAGTSSSVSNPASVVVQ